MDPFKIKTKKKVLCIKTWCVKCLWWKVEELEIVNDDLHCIKLTCVCMQKMTNKIANVTFDFYVSNKYLKLKMSCHFMKNHLIILQSTSVVRFVDFSFSLLVVFLRLFILLFDCCWHSSSIHTEFELNRIEQSEYF